ncbi:hypothetical protein M8C21_012502, partial [Ambrosia artemisiifolia]
ETISPPSCAVASTVCMVLMETVPLTSRTVASAVSTVPMVAVPVALHILDAVDVIRFQKEKHQTCNLDG